MTDEEKGEAIRAENLTRGIRNQLTPREALRLIRGMKGLNFVGGDVVEVAPAYDPSTNTAQNGAQMFFEILSLMQFSPSLPKMKVKIDDN